MAFPEWLCRSVDFWGAKKTGKPGEKTLRTRTRTNKLNPCTMPGRESNPGNIGGI